MNEKITASKTVILLFARQSDLSFLVTDPFERDPKCAVGDYFFDPFGPFDDDDRIWLAGEIFPTEIKQILGGYAVSVNMIDIQYPIARIP